MTHRTFAVLVVFTLLAPFGGCSSNNTGAAIKEFNKAEDFAERKDWDMAIACYTEAIRLNPDFVHAYFKRGNAYAYRDEFDLAIKDYTEASCPTEDFAVKTISDNGLPQRNPSPN